MPSSAASSVPPRQPTYRPPARTQDASAADPTGPSAVAASAADPFGASRTSTSDSPPAAIDAAVTSRYGRCHLRSSSQRSPPDDSTPQGPRAGWKNPTPGGGAGGRPPAPGGGGGREGGAPPP